MTTLEVLKAARELISDEKHWTQGKFERQYNGYRAYCSTGALCASGGSTDSDAYHYLAEVMGCESLDVCEWNDSHTHAEVLAKFDEAIVKLEAA